MSPAGMAGNMKVTQVIQHSLGALRAEYLRQLALLAAELRPGFESGQYGNIGAPDDADDPSANHRLVAAIEERLPVSKPFYDMVKVASPNAWQALDQEWNDERRATCEAIAVDLCVVSEEQGWARSVLSVSETWGPWGQPSPVRPVNLESIRSAS